VTIQDRARQNSAGIWASGVNQWFTLDLPADKLMSEVVRWFGACVILAQALFSNPGCTAADEQKTHCWMFLRSNGMEATSFQQFRGVDVSLLPMTVVFLKLAIVLLSLDRGNLFHLSAAFIAFLASKKKCWEEEKRAKCLLWASALEKKKCGDSSRYQARRTRKRRSSSCFWALRVNVLSDWSFKVMRKWANWD